MSHYSERQGVLSREDGLQPTLLKVHMLLEIAHQQTSRKLVQIGILVFAHTFEDRHKKKVTQER